MYNGANIQVWVDGVLKQTLAATGAIQYPRGTGLFVGQHGFGGTDHNMNGLIDEIRVYDHALTSARAAHAAKDLRPVPRGIEDEFQESVGGSFRDHPHASGRRVQHKGLAFRFQHVDRLLQHRHGESRQKVVVGAGSRAGFAAPQCRVSIAPTQRRVVL